MYKAQRANGVIQFRHLNTDTAASNKKQFFQKVCQLVNTTASPKQPQSDIGLSIANHKVSGVITPIISSMNKGVVRLRMPNNRYTPKQNSIIACNTDAKNGKNAGTNEVQPKASR